MFCQEGASVLQRLWIIESREGRKILWKEQKVKN